MMLCGELDEARWEVRKVEVFVGRMTYAEGRDATGDTKLREVPVPSVLVLESLP